MRVAILAGGKGTRLEAQTTLIPKVMVPIGSRPILMHIIDHYRYFGFQEFLVALGHMGDVVKRYFLEPYVTRTHLVIEPRGVTSDAAPHGEAIEAPPGCVHLLDTGLDTNTGGRLGALREWLRDAPFMVAYGDGLADVDLRALLEFHRGHGRMATLTATQPPPRFGELVCDGDLVTSFAEKPPRRPRGDRPGAADPGLGPRWINAGFFVFEPAIFDLIGGTECVLEADVLPHLAAERQLAVYRHYGFWQCMDTAREMRLLQDLWDAGSPPWKLG